jgi:hypothetical protein
MGDVDPEGGVTVSTKATCWFTEDGLTDEVSEIPLVVALPT